MRALITCSYNGTHFLGSQTQTETKNTIFGQIEYIFNELNITSKPQPSGRTDKGVHASGQTFHIDLPEFWNDLKKLKRILNEMLPNSIKILSIKEVDAEFHARYSAKSRVYRYLIKTNESNPFEDDFISFYTDADFKSIQKNISLFIGEHDFREFMKTGSEINSTTREIYKAYAYKKDDLIVLNFEANGFLRSQIRLMVGALLNLDATQIKEQLDCKKQYKIKPATPNGLYLAKIKY
ncbi:tRNA pseudouridine(38-40) synthase TruA [Sulfurimonas lithotrophica]|uniref:tRNA pseudouridine synthase A n=1 Tax=Sulfurimonas lithotrophica TaxID=2590022 RepID=A0A5P8P0S3_9BACT|nr:tRNA pseudouridine(38-40) synthase TruA [Sulfurimonas lithotrophica]QFR49201.1 tRNA pseudouridine(38-40) synthase TruA [Sulfurimonas lithotrophica]